MLATVRNRHVVSAVSPFDGATEGRLHLVTVEYADVDGGADDQLVWEVGTRGPPVGTDGVARSRKVGSDAVRGLVRATRWTAMSPFCQARGRGFKSRRPRQFLEA